METQQNGNSGKCFKITTFNSCLKNRENKYILSTNCNEYLKTNDSILNDKESEGKNHVLFIIDSGATEHITNSQEIFSSFKETEKSIIKCANKDSRIDLTANGIGTVSLIPNNQNKIIKLNTIYSKSLSENLISLRNFAEAGLTTYFDDKSVEIYDPRTNETLVSGIYDKPYWKIESTINKESKNESYIPTKAVAFDAEVVTQEPNQKNKIEVTNFVE